MSDIDTLLISHSEVNLSVPVVNNLVNNGVNIILCDNRKLPNSYILGYKVQKQSFNTFKKQLAWDETYKSKCWSWICALKIKNQLDLLTFYKKQLPTWDVDPPASLMEAKIASHFFRQLYGNTFTRKKEHSVNCLLDYGYTIITNMVARSLVKKGLNTQISFFHGSLYTTDPLAYDIVEIFRIVIDHFCAELWNSGIIKKDTKFGSELKHCLVDFIANYKIIIDEKFEYLNNAMDIVIDWIIADTFLEHKINYEYELETDHDEKNTSERVEQL